MLPAACYLLSILVHGPKVVDHYSRITVFFVQDTAASKQAFAGPDRIALVIKNLLAFYH